MKRRTFMAALAAVAACPPIARAQQGLPLIGVLGSTNPDSFGRFLVSFHAGLGEVGYTEGKNVSLVYRWAGGQYDRLPALARELVALKVDLILASGGAPPTLAAKAATASIPVVFTAISDPHESGLVESLNRPGGNLTGVAILTAELDSKRLELLYAAVPQVKRIAVLANPSRTDFAKQTGDVMARARELGVDLQIFRASDAQQIDTAFAGLAARGANALLVLADPYFTSRREQIVALAARYAIPGMYQWREFAVAGGLLSYGPSIIEAYRQSGVYAGRILKGEKPAALPVLQPAKFEFVVNSRAAKSLGLAIPDALLARADEVIE